MKFSEMKYERPDMNGALQKFKEATACFKKSNSSAEQYTIYKELEELESGITTMMTICSIRNSVDTSDEFYENEREYCDKNGPLLDEEVHAFHSALLSSRFRAELETRLGVTLFRNMEIRQKAFSPKVTSFIQQENLLEAKYQKLYASAKIEFDGEIVTIAQLVPYKESTDRAVRRAACEAEGRFFDSHKEEFDSLYDQLVKNRTEQAKMLGFESYVPLGYLRQNRNCYGPHEVESFRRDVEKDVVPLVNRIKTEQASRLGVLDFAFWDDALSFPDGNATPQGSPKELLDDAQKMYQEMSPETAEFIDMMFDRELFDVLAKKGKAPGGYCTDLPDYHCPFIFSNFNGTSGDVDVLTHEAGHAFASFVADREIETAALRQPTLEACETHSMTMEFLTSPWHSLFFKEQTPKYEVSHAENTLIFLPYGCMVDHFQELVYSKPNMTPQERNEVWLKLEKLYRPYNDFKDLPFYSRGAGWQRQLHIYLNPFYYIDYCLAQTMALQFWSEFRKDQKNAWSKYLSFVRMGGTKTFTQLIQDAGLKSPFEPGCVREAVSEVKAWLEHKYRSLQS